MKSKGGAWFASLALLITSAVSFRLAAQINGSGTPQFVSTPSSGDGLVLRDRENAIFWSGTATTAPPNGQQPNACTNLGIMCAEFDLTIDLPNNTWEHSGGVQVAIRWSTDDNALDLFVYQHDACKAVGPAVPSVPSDFDNFSWDSVQRVSWQATFEGYTFRRQWKHYT